MTSATRSVLAGSAATLLGTAVSAALSVVYISLGARWLGPADYAGVAGAISTANIVFIALNPVEAGLTLTMAGYTGRGELSQLHDFLERAFRGLLYSAAAILSVWLALSAWANAQTAVSWLALFCCATLVACATRAALRGRELFVDLAGNWILDSGVRLVLGLWLMALQLGPSGMVAGYGLGTVAAVLHGLVRARRDLPRSVHSRSDERSVLRDVVLPLRSLSAPLLGLHLYMALVVNVDVLAANRYLPAHEAGMYGGAASIARIVLVGAQPLLLVLFSRLASMSAARAETDSTLRLGAVVVLAGLALSLLIPWFGAELILRGFLGSAYAGAASVLLWQWATACVLIAQVFFAESMLATSNVRGGWLCIVPAIVLVICLALWHESAVGIAKTCFLVCATAGSATFVLLWRWRTLQHVSA